MSSFTLGKQYLQSADPCYSGIGLATAQRLIDEFLTKRSLTSHLIIIPTTRSKTKSKDTINTLREYANNAARTNKILQSRVGQVSDIEYEWEEHAERIHLLSVQLDLCDIRGIYEVADTMCRGTLSNPPGVEGQDAQLQNMRLPRLDSIVCNAAYGGWSGCDYPHAIYSMLFEGFLDAVTQPKFKNSLPTRILNEQASYQYVSLTPCPLSASTVTLLRLTIPTSLPNPNSPRSSWPASSATTSSPTNYYRSSAAPSQTIILPTHPRRHQAASSGPAASRPKARP